MSAWKDHVTASLIGCGKATPSELPAPLRSALGEITTLDAEARFLTQAGALALWREAGWTPARHTTEILAAEPEATVPLSPASVGHLRAMMAGRYFQIFLEWLGEVARQGRHLPPELLPALLNRTRERHDLRAPVLAAGGRRAAWLAAQNPVWSFASSADPALWETGTREQRRAILRDWRERSPAEAREKLEAVWATEPAENRAEFLAEFFTELSLDDVPLLERALTDRSKDVRRIALSCLGSLPGSAFVERMTARVAPLLQFSRGGLLSRPALEVTLPPEPDADARRDGLDPKTFGLEGRIGARAVLLVVLLSAVPLRHWTEAFQQSPEVLVKAAEKNEFARVLITGWAWAAVRQRDIAWAEALLGCPVAPHQEFPFQPEDLWAILPASSRATRLVPVLRQALGGDVDAGITFRSAVFSFQNDLPEAVAREFLTLLRRQAAKGVPVHLQPTYEYAFFRLPPALLGEAVTGWPVDQEGVASLIELLTFRHEVLTALRTS